MQRHLIDHPRVVDASSRLRAFLWIDRQSGLHPAVRSLYVRAQDHTETDARLRHFLRIERGHTV